MSLTPVAHLVLMVVFRLCSCHVDKDLSVNNLERICLERNKGRRTQRPTAPHVEPTLVERAFDNAIYQNTIG